MIRSKHWPPYCFSARSRIPLVQNSSACEEMEEMAGDKTWKLEVVDVPGQDREFRGTLDAVPEDTKDEEGKKKGEKTVGNEE